MQLRLKNILPVLAVVAALLASGCIFSPERKPPKVIPPPDYELPISPTNVLLNLIAAYNGRDSIETKAVYDVNYQGTSSDPTAPQPIVQFTRDDEVHHVKRLHDDPNIVGVSLDFGQSSTWQVNPANASDPPEWRTIPIQYQLISIDDASNNTVYQSDRSIIEFSFKPTEKAPGDTVWTVVRWDERLQ